MSTKNKADSTIDFTKEGATATTTASSETMAGRNSGVPMMNQLRNASAHPKSRLTEAPNQGITIT